MPENEFEKQVQQKMEEFRVRPSAEVWTAVEERIREKKRRRFIFWWPLLLLIGGGIAAGILLLNDRRENKGPLSGTDTDAVTVPSRDISQPEEKNSAAGIATDNSETKNTPGINGTGDVAETKPVSQQQDVTAPASLPVGTGSLSNKAPAHLVKSKNGRKGKRVAAQPTTLHTSVDEIGKSTSEVPASATIKPAVTDAEVQPVIDTDVSTKISTPDSAGKEDAKTFVAAVTLPVKTDSVAQPVSVNIPAKEKKKQAWQRSFTFSLGRSTVVDSAGLGFFRGNSVADMYVSGGGGSGTTPGLSRFVGPSTVYNSTSFSAGMQWSKKINRKLELQLGAGYSYLSSRIKVGNRADSSRFINNSLSANLVTRDYYRYDSAGRTNNYRNQYHFISLSAGLSLRVVQGKKFSLDWVNNLAYRRLFFSTMLHYDGTIPGYYKDNSLLNRNQFFFTTGLSVPFQKGFALEPYFSYGFTPVLKKGNGSAKHYADVGIRISFLLNKK
ncbi:MAG: hypothetical protein JNM88_13325 [Chitinophagaceae bacterium]|nr:hypothetical protein [Chitinophagaceae bacterium]